MDEVVIEPGCILGLAASAIEAYNRETNGYLLGEADVRRPRRTVLKASIPLQTEARKPSGVEHGNARAFDRARRTVRLEAGLRRVGGFHSHTGDDGAPALSETDLDYIAQELGWANARLPRPWADQWLEVVVAIRRRAYARPRRRAWTWRRYARKVGCTVAIKPSVGYDMTFSGYWVPVSSNGGPGRAEVGRPSEAALRVPWRRRRAQ
jgi:proteasome lid subunit RPN8/RPN11